VSEFASAPALPGVKQELIGLRETFGDRLSHVVEDRAATEDQLLAVLSMPGIAFVATHGMNIADQPLLSYVMCEPATGDGKLTALEIYGASLNAQVVVLSACYSGLGDRSPLPGDDLFGLQRALLSSGVHTVVGGLWDVYDDTGALIMRSFFEHLSAGSTTPRALANAQRDFLRARREDGPKDFWIHPYFWAVHKATGSDQTRLSLQ
jgi:CHAT domain-containing protein